MALSAADKREIETLVRKEIKDFIGSNTLKQFEDKLLDMVIVVLKTLGRLIPVLSDKAELAKIGRYYATESMLVWDPQKSAYDEHATPSFGSQTLHAHYEHMLHNRIDVDLGQHSVF